MEGAIGTTSLLLEASGTTASLSLETTGVTTSLFIEVSGLALSSTGVASFSETESTVFSNTTLAFSSLETLALLNIDPKILGICGTTLSATLTTGTGIGNGNLSGKITTPTIQTSFSVASSNFNIGNTVPINIGVNNVNHTYTLRYEIGKRTGTIATNQTNGSYVWTMGDDLINQIKIDNPKTKTVKVKIYCDTYNGETLKGTKNTTVDGTIVDIPEIDVPTRVEQVAKIQALTNSQYVVKDVSKFKFTFGTTAPSGTTIAKYVVYIGDRTIESTTNEFIVENIIDECSKL